MLQKQVSDLDSTNIRNNNVNNCKENFFEEKEILKNTELYFDNQNETVINKLKEELKTNKKKFGYNEDRISHQNEEINN